MGAETTTRAPVVFVHGLWLHAESWGEWLEFFRAKGYETYAAAWPGDAENTEKTRLNANALAGYGVREIADHIASRISALPRKPVLVGHSFGGLLVQNLLGRDLASAGVAIDPAPIRGVSELPLSALRSAIPVLRNPLNIRRSVGLTEQEFHFGFTNMVPAQEAKLLYEKYAMPGPGRPLFQAATAALNPRAATSVNVLNPKRGPLLLISGWEDNTVPPVLVRSTLRAYRNSPAVTELKEFGGRGHSLTIDSGWRDIAEYTHAWLNGKGF